MLMSNKINKKMKRMKKNNNKLRKKNTNTFFNYRFILIKNLNL